VTLHVGQIVGGKFRIGRLIGRGGMGEVYEATHEQIDRRVAIKVVRPGPDLRQATPWFEREARAAGRIGNDHILEVLDVGELADGARYLVTEFLDGETLEARLVRDGRLAQAEVARLAAQLLDGLGAAHRAGVIHRDLKPANIFLLKRKLHQVDFVKIIDFGISKFQLMSPDTACNVTATLAVVGTPAYLSPEQARGSCEVDARSDLYGLGAILYEAVAARRSFEADNLNDLMFKIALEDPVPVEQLVPDLHPGLANIIHKAMARSPDDRYPSAERMLEAVVQWAQDAGISLAFLAPGAPEPRPARAFASGSLPGPSADTLAASPPVQGSDTLSVHHLAKVRGPAPSKRLLLVMGGGLALAVAVVALAMLLAKPHEPDVARDAAVRTPTADGSADTIPSSAEQAPAQAVAPPAPTAPPVSQSESLRVTRTLDAGRHGASPKRPRMARPAVAPSSVVQPRPKQTAPPPRKRSEWGY
jgi:serine/threonine protein kinase